MNIKQFTENSMNKMKAELYTHFPRSEKNNYFLLAHQKRVEEWTCELIRNSDPQGASARNTGKGILTIPTSLGSQKVQAPDLCCLLTKT